MSDGIIKLDEGWRLDEGHHFDEPPNVPPPVPPPLPRPKEKGKHMDMVPKKRSQRYLWYKNISDNIATEGPKFGLTPAEAAATKALTDAIMASMEATDTAQGILDGARTTEQSVEGTNLTQLRAKVRNWKTLPAFPASGSEGVLQLKGAEAEFDPATYKPAIRVSIEGGKVVVSGAKKGVEAFAIYARLRGSQTWERLAVENHPPYYDTRPLAQLNVPEVREYMVRGVVDDQEIGLDSDIISVTFAG
ncbi:MAG: hypothetical protein HZC54_04875 [Verrucomicrobia bacterium]|nr:hypothetical protein [Verrucomicrobiota bacterium]